MHDGFLGVHLQMVHSHISPNNIVDACMLALIRIQYVNMSIQCKLQNTIECNVMKYNV